MKDRSPDEDRPSAPVASVAIDHPTLPTVVAESLRRLIAAGTLAPGAHLNERELCDQLRVSRTPLREAFRVLCAEGLVELTPKYGARVTELSDDDVANIFDVLARARLRRQGLRHCAGPDRGGPAGRRIGGGDAGRGDA